MRINLVSMFSLAYSLRYMAANRPMGRENSVERETRYIVPIIAGYMPPAFILFLGMVVKNSQLTTFKPFFITTPSTNKTGSTTITVHKNNMAKAIFCLEVVFILFSVPV